MVVKRRVTPGTILFIPFVYLFCAPPAHALFNINWKLWNREGKGNCAPAVFKKPVVPIGVVVIPFEVRANGRKGAILFGLEKRASGEYFFLIKSRDGHDSRWFDADLESVITIAILDTGHWVNGGGAEVDFGSGRARGKNFSGGFFEEGSFFGPGFYLKFDRDVHQEWLDEFEVHLRYRMEELSRSARHSYYSRLSLRKLSVSDQQARQTEVSGVSVEIQEHEPHPEIAPMTVFQTQMGPFMVYVQYRSIGSSGVQTYFLFKTKDLAESFVQTHQFVYVPF